MRRLVLILVAALAVSCGDNGGSHLDKRQEVCRDLKREYVALGSWYEALDSVRPGWRSVFDYANIPFTYHADDAIEWLNGRPVVFMVGLDDIVRDDSGYTAHFSNLWSFGVDSVGDYHGLLTLRCSQEQADRLAAISKGIFPNLVVVARIRSFKRPRLSLSVESDGDADYMWISANNEIAALHGQLIDARQF